MRSILFILFGWLLGILSPIIVDNIRQQRINKEIKRAIITELNDLEYRLMVFSFSILKHTGKIKQQFLKWATSVMSSYTGPYENRKVRETMETISNQNDDQLAVIFSARQREAGLRISKIEIPFTTSKVDSLSSFSINFQKIIISILSQLMILNEEITFSQNDFNKTFLPSISKDNLGNILANLNAGYDRMADRARTITKMITEARKMNS